MAPRRTPQQKIIDAALALAETRPWREILLSDIATEAKVSLGKMRAEFSGKTAILKALMAQIDAQVLDGAGDDVVDEIARDRLFDVLMLRLELMEPYKAALKNIIPGLKRDPALVLELSSAAFRSARWMLVAAGLETSGARGFVRERGLALVFGKTLDVWLRDDDAGLAKTMAELDMQLRRGEDWLKNIQRPLGVLSVAAGFAKSFVAGCAKRKSARNDEEPVAQG